MQLRGFLAIAYKRLKSRTFLTLLVVWSMALTVAVTICIPLFSEGVSRLILQEELNRKTQSINRPPFSVRFSTLPKARTPLPLDEAQYARDWIGDMLRREVGLPVRSVYAQFESPTLYTVQGANQRYDASVGPGHSVTLAFVDDIEGNIRVTEGTEFGVLPAPTAEGATLYAWILPTLADQMHLQVGDRVNLSYSLRPGFPTVAVQVAGYWEPVDGQDQYWYWDPQSLFRSTLLTTEAQYREHLLPITAEGTGFTFWYYVLDESRMNLDRVEQYITGLRYVEQQVATLLPEGSMGYSPSVELVEAQSRKNALSIALFSFALPLLGILAFFIAAVSSIVARYQMQESVMFVSRGLSRSQLMGLFLGETVLILLVATPLGIVLGMGIARVLGNSMGFMAFTLRPPLAVHIAAANWTIVIGGMVMCLLSRLAPTWVTMRSNIVSFERENARREATFGIARLLLLAILGAITYYTYQRLAQLGTLGFADWTLDTGPVHDPLLLLGPTLFVFTASLAAAESFILLMRVLALVGRFIPSVTAYLGCMNLAREGRHYRVPIYLLVLCLSLGVFYASLARSADIWLVDRLRYQVGADLTFRHLFGAQAAAMDANISGEDASLLPVETYTQIQGVEAAARVGDYQADVLAGRDAPRVRVLAIDRLDFARVVHWRSDYASLSLGELMNRLAIEPSGALIASGLAETLSLEMGDRIDLNILFQEGDEWRRANMGFNMVGTFDYFPTMYESDAPLVVVNLNHLQMEAGGVAAQAVWLNLAPDAQGEPILDSVTQISGLPVMPQDLRRILDHDQQLLERVGIFGMLTFCFLAGAMLAGMGLLIYGFAALSGRIFRLAVLRAMGLKHREMVSVISFEYAVAMLYGLVAGLALGAVASTLYVPFFPLTQEAVVQIPPFLPFTDWNSGLWMALAMGLVLSVIEGGILVRMARTPAFQALRLGSRE